MGLFSAVINGVEHSADDLEKLTDQAFNEIENIGLSITGSIGPFIKFLMGLGEDPVQVIERMSSYIGQIGGDVGSTLEEIASGVVSQGLTSFATSKLTAVIEPIITALKTQSNVGHQVASVHQTTLTTMQVKLDSLTVKGNTGTTWQGGGAQAMQTQFTALSASLTSLNSSIDFDGAQDALNSACIRALGLIRDLALGLVVVDLLLLVVEAVVAVASLGTGVLVEAPLDAGVIAAEIGLLLTLVAADLIAWIIGTVAIHLIQIATTHTSTVQSPAKPQILHLNLPKEPELTPEQEAAVDELVRELAAQLGVNPISLKAWLKLLVQAMGTGMTTAQIKNTIRCLASKGYLSTDTSKAWNSIAGHLTPRDIQGAWGDNNGYDTSADHAKEVGDSLKSLENFIEDLNKKLSDYNLSPAKRAYYNTLKAAAQKTYNYVQRLINLGKKQGPSTKDWEDPKARVPFPEDILKGSGCLPS